MEIGLANLLNQNSIEQKTFDRIQSKQNNHVLYRISILIWYKTWLN